MTASQELLDLVSDVNNAEVLSVTDEGSPVVYGTEVEGAELMAPPTHAAWVCGGKIGIAKFEGVWILHPSGEIEPHDVRISATFGKQRIVELHLHAVCDEEGNFTGLKRIDVFQTPLDEETRKAGLKRWTRCPISQLTVADVQTPEFWVQLLV